MIPKDQKV